MRIIRNILIIGISTIILVISSGCGSTSETTSDVQSSSPTSENTKTPEAAPNIETEKTSEPASQSEQVLESTTPTSTAVTSTPPSSTTATPTTTVKPVNTPSTITTPSPTSPPTSTSTPAPTNISYTQNDYYAITFSDIKETLLTNNVIDVSNSPSNQLTPGTILLYRTNEQRYGKLFISEYGDSIKFRWVTYTTAGNIFTQGDGLSIKSTSICDLDLGTMLGSGEDLWYQKINDTERYLVPKNGAIFAIYNPGNDSAPVNPSLAVTQEIEWILSIATYKGYFVAYEKYLTAGDNIAGYMQINGESGVNVSWYFQIVNPDGGIERSWTGDGTLLSQNSKTELEFSHTVIKTGMYIIRVVHYTECEVTVYIKLSPLGWQLTKEGTGSTAWKIAK